MADPVSMLGTVVGVASLAIQVTQITHAYCNGVSKHKSEVEALLLETEHLQQVLAKFEDFVRVDPLQLAQSFMTTSPLYITNTLCKARLASLLSDLQHRLQRSKTGLAITALKWPFKAQETQKLAGELRAYSQTFHFALTLDGCQLLLKTSDQVTQTLQASKQTASIAGQNAESIALMLSVITQSHERIQDIERGVQKLVNEKILEWLGPTNTSAKHQTLQSKRSPGTGEWISQAQSYKQWQDGLLPILWAQGKPGAGKSTLMPRIVDQLKGESSRNEGVASFYCDISQAAGAQTPEAILASFSNQLLQKLGYIPDNVNDNYVRHRRESTRPYLSDHIEILRQISAEFSNVWLLIDALDELNQDCRKGLMEAIESMMTCTSIFLASRPQSIDSEIVVQNTLHCAIYAQRQDLMAFIKTRLATASRGLRDHPGWNAFVRDAGEKLTTMADGMFILVSLQLDELLRLPTLVEMRKALEIISDKVDDFYKTTLDRIRAAGSETPLKILAWVTTFPKPLTLGALQEALAVEYSEIFINTDALIPEDDIIPMLWYRDHR